ncbi:Acyl-CoA dehydrogenase [Maioricimonas rarisocia]|uniref:Acyl-CoA dehydrogenase n=1 Tax=Maioricimonas rarisocia TaxID=2528026 RepID=A0A517ZAQ8_9PLAN|nr:acyl-CoA dehydrogenase family protein [Maioricimonas rarisocia]QDU39511.1 Acyl-CoA dehydrogenase [Maioricimonas rarisocia]
MATVQKPDRPSFTAKKPVTSFASEALKLGGKSDDEVARMGAVDAADDRVETLFAQRYQTVNSPVHRAVWEKAFPLELFDLEQPIIEPSPAAEPVMRASLDVVRRHVQAGTVLDDANKISAQVMRELGEAGYWGLLIGPEYGGSGASFTQFATFLTQMAAIEPTVAGLASVHGCIGAVDPLLTFGNDDQKNRLLPDLASGARLSAFALTEPGAGSDLTALRTTAVRDGDDYVLNGEKLFITNVLPGRTVSVVCLIDGEPAVLVAKLPDKENEHFQLKRYGLYALQHAHNYGILFRDFRVPVENRLAVDDGDGLTIAYHGLNRGRGSLCANAAGAMRLMLADMRSWARFRRTYGEPIMNRELVQRRTGEMAGLIVACDALTNWCAGLLDLGYRGEMECIVAKIYGSEAQKRAAIELHMKTHGGRSFLQGHLFGDNVHDFLAPCIYEGEGEMLGLAFFKSLVKQHGRQYFEAIGRTLQSAGIRKPNLAHPAHLWALRAPLRDYSGWWLRNRMSRSTGRRFSTMGPEIRPHAEFAAKLLQQAAFEISATMRKHQLKLADRQCRMAELSARIQKAVVILCTSFHVQRQTDDLVRRAGAVEVERLTNELRGQRPSDAFLRRVTSLGADLADQDLPGLEEVDVPPILMRYGT